MKFAQGLDLKIRWAFTGGIFFLLVGSLATVFSIAVDNPPDFSRNHFKTGLFYSASAIISGVALIGLYFTTIKGSYLFVVSSLAFASAGAACGYKPKVMALIFFSSMMILLFPVVFGEKSDLASETKKIKIKVPWQ